MVIFLLNEYIHPVIPSLRDVMRKAWYDNATASWNIHLPK